jgi:hypothetical protein
MGVPLQVILLRRGDAEVDPGPLAGQPGQFAVLQLGRVGKDLAALQSSETWGRLGSLPT